VASLVLSIVTLFGLGSILGIVFGFVARRQVARSGGAEKGEGLALAGIIVGFITLALVLAAVAIPTFLGVSRNGAVRSGVSSNVSVVRLTPAPIGLSAPQEGGTTLPVPWRSESVPVDTTVTAVPGGVDMQIAQPEQTEWTGVPLMQAPVGSMQLAATVAIVSGNLDNRIGLGCVTAAEDHQFAFFVTRAQLWQIELFSVGQSVIVDEGTSGAIRSSGANQLTISCSDDVASPGRTLVRFAVNGTPVASDVVGVGASAWAPSIQLCSCRGPDTGQYTDVAYYAPTGATPSSPGRITTLTSRQQVGGPKVPGRRLAA
jgi:hypothetical protein